jgi:hypothetical protein
MHLHENGTHQTDHAGLTREDTPEHVCSIRRVLLDDPLPAPQLFIKAGDAVGGSQAFTVWLRQTEGSGDLIKPCVQQCHRFGPSRTSVRDGQGTGTSWLPRSGSVSAAREGRTGKDGIRGYASWGRLVIAPAVVRCR